MSPEHISARSTAVLHDCGATIGLVAAGSILRIGRTKSHELAPVGEFPRSVLRSGRRNVVTVAYMLRLPGLDESTARGTPTATGAAVSTPCATFRRGSPFVRDAEAGSRRHTQGQRHSVQTLSGGQSSLLRQRHARASEWLTGLAWLSAHFVARFEAGMAILGADAVNVPTRAFGVKSIKLFGKYPREPLLWLLCIAVGRTVDDIISCALDRSFKDVMVRERRSKLRVGALVLMSTIDEFVHLCTGDSMKIASSDHSYAGASFSFSASSAANSRRVRPCP